MGIETSIKQKTPFRSSYHKAMVNIMYLASVMSEHVGNQVKPYGLTPQQYNVLRILRGAQTPLSTSEIRERMLDKMSDTSRIVERLAEKELVLKTTSMRDKRLVDVRITQKGLNILGILDEKADALEAQVRSVFSEEEAEMLNSLLDRLHPS